MIGHLRSGASRLAVLAVLGAVAVVLGAREGRAAEDIGAYGVERFRPAIDGEGILDVDSANVLSPWEVNAALWLGYAHEPLAVYRRTGDALVRAGALVGPRVGANALLAIGVLDWLELGVDVPVVVFQARGALPEELPLSPLTPTGLGDVRLVPKLQVLRAERAFVDLALVPHLTLPTSLPRGDYLGEKFVTVAPELVVSRDLRGTRLAAGAGYRARSFTKSGGVVAGHEAFYRLGVALPLEGGGARPPVVLEGTIDGAVTVLPEPGAHAPLEALGGARIDLGPLELYCAGGAGILGAPGVPDFRALVGVRYTADIVDGDRDGVQAAADRCPDQAEDLDRHADDDGCPEDDADGDGVGDAADRCPQAPEDADGFEDQDGCVDDDNDLDGVVDARDRCPRSPGDLDFDGCRPPDRDADRVPDHLDACPDIAARGYANGCLPVVVEVKPQRIEFKEPLQFATGSAVLSPESAALCDSIAATLAAHPEVVRIRIEGHTDDTGYREQNMKLSRRRAEAVRDALVTRGIAAARLVAEGFGASRPIVEGTSADARRQNRRVELIVIPQDQADAASEQHPSRIRAEGSEEE